MRRAYDRALSARAGRRRPPEGLSGQESLPGQESPPGQGRRNAGLAIGAVLGGLLGAALAGAGPAAATPTMEQAIAFSRTEIGRACGDSKRTRIDAIDQLAEGSARTCRVTLQPGRLKISVRQRGGASAADYARMWLDISFNRKSRFICGPTGEDQRATLFITCDTERIVNGRSCASRKVTLARPGGDNYRSQKDLSSLGIMRLAEDSCEVISRAMNFIGLRVKEVEKFRVREYFSEMR